MSVLHPSITTSTTRGAFHAHIPPATPVTPGTPGTPLLTAEHHAAIAAARGARRPMERAVKVASFSAVSLAVFAAVSLLFSLSSWKGAFVANGLVACAWFEFTGRNALRRFEARGVTTLMWNQVALGGVMLVYCLWCMAEAWSGRGGYAEVIANHPELADILGPYEDLFRQVTIGSYAVVLLVSLGVQALMVAYYRRTRRRLAAYLRGTPEWVREIAGA